MDHLTQKPITATRMARRLGVRAAWLRSEADAGRLPHVRAGDRYLFDPATVERILLDRARGTDGEPAPAPTDGGRP